MASWMVHLRVADKLMDAIPNLSEKEFIVGNIAPDSGVPNADWSAFSPSTTVSHFKTVDKNANPAAFAAKYFTPEQQAQYSEQQYSFYLGYLTHLMTDVLWVKEIFEPTKQKFPQEFAADPDFIWKVKEDWYDLDFKYLRDHPGFQAFRIYQSCEGFCNDFMEEFSADAFDNRRQYICSFYEEQKDNLDREYPFLTESEMDAFVERGAAAIGEALHLH